MIQLKNIRVAFNQGTPLQVSVLNNISLNIRKGEFVTLIGGNGAGKSTLLNTLTGDVRPQSGVVSIDDKVITKWPVHKRAPFIARVFQDPMKGTCPELSVEENLALALCRGENRGIALALSPHTREKIVHHLKDLHLGLERRLKDPVGLLSGGQRQTLSLLMAILRPMKILALDEHTAALDPKTASFVIELTKKIVEERQLTTLMVTHSMSHALNVGTRTIMLHHGKIVLDISGEKRKKLSVPDLLNLFKKNSGDKIEESSLLLD